MSESIEAAPSHFLLKYLSLRDDLRALQVQPNYSFKEFDRISNEMADLWYDLSDEEQEIVTGDKTAIAS